MAISRHGCPPSAWDYGGNAGVWNLAFGLLAGLTGLYMTWGIEAVTEVSLTMNKSMFGTFAVLSLAIMIWIRYRYGPRLWDDPSLRLTYTAMGFIASGMVIVTGSLGGEAALLGTVLDWLWRLLNIEPRFPMVMPVWGSAVLIGLTIMGIASALAYRLVLRSREAAK